MRIIISADGNSLDAPASPVFGRCPTYILVDTTTSEFQALANPAMNQGGGAGIQAAQFVVRQGVQGVLTGNLGPNAFDVLQAAGIPAYAVLEGTVRHALEAFAAGRLQPLSAANVAAHAGMGGGGSRRGKPLAEGPSEPEQDVAQLKESLKGLRQQLAETMDRIEQLERETTKREG
mgnify:CR=1 FL=1